MQTLRALCRNEEGDPQMTLVSNDLQNLEQRFKSLREKLMQRTAQHALPDAPGTDPYMNPYGRSDVHTESVRKELMSVAAQLVALKYDPCLVIATMESMR